MREKLKTLPLVQLREMAKAQGLKGISTLKKAEIIDRLCELEKPAEGGQKEETPQASVSEHPAGSAELAERTEMHMQPRRTDAGAEYIGTDVFAAAEICQRRTGCGRAEFQL